MHPALSVLAATFDDAARAGKPRAVWWRDDDAVQAGPRLAALTAVAARHGAPMALAVIPQGASDDLLAFAADADLAVLQHGVGHHNHQSTGKAAELGDARSVDTIVADCVAARARLAATPTFVAAMVPPWNRIRADLAGPLAAAGYFGLSCFGASWAQGALTRVDTHIDPIAWRTTRDLAEAEALATMANAARAVSGPIGLLTHHRDHTPAIDAFVEAFASIVTAHPGAVWVDARALFGPAA